MVNRTTFYQAMYMYLLLASLPPLTDLQTEFCTRMCRQSANVLEQNLPVASRHVFAGRAAMELIVILDWRSTALIPAETLFHIKQMLLKVRMPLTTWVSREFVSPAWCSTLELNTYSKVMRCKTF